MDAMDIVVGIDGSIHAALALDWAADEAARRKSRLVVVYAASVLDGAAYSSATLNMMRADATVHGEQVLTEALTSVRAAHPDLSTTTVLRYDLPADLLIELSGPESIVVVGCRGGGRVAGALFGSVAQRVAAHATGTVVVVGDGSRGQANRRGILVGVSDSAGGRAALAFAGAEAARRGSRVTAVRAYGVVGRSRSNYSGLPGVRELEAAILGDALRRLRAEYPDIALDDELLDQDPVIALAELSRDAELLVLGCRHSADHWPSRLGPITGTVLHDNPCPVAIVGIPQPAIGQDAIPTGQPAATPGGSR
jgi:nucleotide-binding universal stress UspA family protein